MKKQVQIEKIYKGYFLMDSGFKVLFDVSEEDGGDDFFALSNDSKFSWNQGDFIWLGEREDYYILADRVIGWSIDEYEQEI